MVKAVRRFEAHFRLVRGAIRGDSPVEDAYAQVPGALPGPTQYGRTALAEGFAEAFALHRTDPESLRRIAPQVWGWFERGEHVQRRVVEGLTTLRKRVEDSDASADAPQPGS